MGRTPLFSSLPGGNTLATLQMVVRNLWRASSLPVPPSPPFCHLHSKGTFHGVGCFSDCGLLSVWWEACLTMKERDLQGSCSEGLWLKKKMCCLKPLQDLTVQRGSSDVSPNPPFSVSILLTFSFTLFPHPQQGEAGGSLISIRSAYRRKCLLVWW